MRNWLIKMLGGWTKEEAERYCRGMNHQLQEIVAKHDMQAAWSQVKMERKQGRYQH